MEETDRISVFMETDELTDAVFSLQNTCDLLDRVESENLYWKWILIIFHNSLQSFMVASLKDSNPAAIASERDKRVLKKWVAFHTSLEERLRIFEEKKPLEEPSLRGFWGLYERMQSESQHGSSFFNTPLEPTKDQTDAIQYLNLLRNDFVHYRPAFKVKDCQQYPRLVLNCLHLARYIVFESGSVIWLKNLENQAKNLIPTIEEKVESLERKYRAAFPGNDR